MSASAVPAWLEQVVARYLDSDVSSPSVKYTAQLLWQRGHCDRTQLEGFLQPSAYQPASAFDFGDEMHQAVERLIQAYERHEQVTIWGDFDADGVTATAVLWEGLGQWFEQETQLRYVIPNRLTESHGLSHAGITALARENCQLLVTCDTGSNNLAELAYAQQMGIDVIVTDHHTLPADRPPVVAILNPRYLPADHPLAHLSGVAVAYKLIEALHQRLPIANQPGTERLLDLVAIGLIADLVELVGDCRYLAQRGIAQLQATQRPGIRRLLELCKRTGDRPTDISFGLGPRINAISRVYGDARRCVELLTSKDVDRCHQLAEAAELANTRRKALQRDITQQVRQRLAQVDLSTTSVIVLADPQWSVGILGLVAGEIARDYNRPTILLQAEMAGDDDRPPLARGSARSIAGIDLYQLLNTQRHLLHRFGGHPLAAGLSLRVENLGLFTDAINQQFRQQIGLLPPPPAPQAELTVTVAELNQSLFQGLKLLEPYGMGNPVPRLLIQNCWFEEVWHENIRDLRGQKVSYIKTTFKLKDPTVVTGFPGVWWGHYKTDVPVGRCDAIVELDVHDKNYVARLVAISRIYPPTCANYASDATTDSLGSHGLPPTGSLPLITGSLPLIIDLRGQADVALSVNASPYEPDALILRNCPFSWHELRCWWQQAIADQRSLVLAYNQPEERPPYEVLRALIKTAQQLSSTEQAFTLEQLGQWLGLSDRAVRSGLTLLTTIGFHISHQETDQVNSYRLSGEPIVTITSPTASPWEFLSTVQSDYFQQRYFAQVPLPVLQAIMQATI
ncbi:MAG: single-stranded-DNA-specific exonuclease RecJ [Cyanobacteria bacterium]|nr:single-stranded-DNA-specific exonuclease RecJ [Cyanobacteriota bacterium]MDW8202675.1 single-stranded-DNA-specific exonuclease RecJ [Cyanobacteriota bacterium SKYGB_h_bin112]